LAYTYIDGHRHIFEERAHKNPSIFHSFAGFNVPERSKPRKCITSNISADQLRESALELSVSLQASFWERPHWCDIKPFFNSILHSLSSYQEQKNKKILIILLQLLFER
jgi:hypothetical protein